MKKLFLIEGAIFFSLSGFAQSNPLSLKQCVETAIANNLPVKQSELLMQTAAVSYNQAKGNIIPQLNGNITHYLNQGRSIDPANNGYINQQFSTANYSLSSNVSLFNGFRLMNALKENKYAYEASKMEWQQSKDKLMLDVMLAYLQVLNNEDLLEQNTRQVEVTKKQADRLETLNKEGAIKPSDYYDIKGQFANDQLSVVNTQNALDAAKLNLAQLMNIAYNKNLEVERLGIDAFDMNYNNMPDSIFQVAMQQLAIIKAVDLRKKSAEKEVKAAKGNLLPSLGLGGGISTNFSSTALDQSNAKIPYYNQLSNNYGTYVGAGITIPILNNFRYRNQVTLAKIDLKGAEYISQTTQIQLKQNIERDYFNMTATTERYKALNDQVTAYTESFRAAEIRFNEGLANSSVEYLIAKNKLDQAKSNLIIARYDYVLRTKILDYYQGKPLW
jgi:outer membrane protein